MRDDLIAAVAQLMEPNSFYGMRIVESVYLTVPVERDVRRSWWERFWSWPWRPWVRTTRVTFQEPSPDVMRLNATTLVAHPATVRALARAVSEGHQ